MAWRYYFLTEFPQLNVICFTSYPNQDVSTEPSRKGEMLTFTHTHTHTHTHQFFQFISRSNVVLVVSYHQLLDRKNYSEWLRTCTEGKVRSTFQRCVSCYLLCIETVDLDGWQQKLDSSQDTPTGATPTNNTAIETTATKCSSDVDSEEEEHVAMASTTGTLKYHQNA